MEGALDEETRVIIGDLGIAKISKTLKISFLCGAAWTEIELRLGSTQELQAIRTDCQNFKEEMAALRLSKGFVQ